MRVKNKRNSHKYPLTFVRTYDQETLEKRYQKAWLLARKAATILKNNYHATRVVVFGSLTNRDFYTPWSDIDLAAWGISDCYFEAASALLDLTSEFQIDLVDPKNARPYILKAIERGIEI